MINKKPYIEVNHDQVACWEGWEDIGKELNDTIKLLRKKKVIITVEFFQGTYEDLNINSLKKVLSPNATCGTRDIFKSENEIRQLVRKDLNFQTASAKISTNTIEDYFDQTKLEAIQQNIEFIEEGVVLIYGVGACKVCPSDILVYSDMSRWEILQRFRRNDISNIGVSNENDPYELQHRWSYFIDWRTCDKIKKQIIGKCDYFMETNNWQKPKLATGDVVRAGFDQATRQPIFMAPFFDPELWDKKVNNELDTEDFAWGFNCDAEEDNVLLKIGDNLFETPAINVVYFQPIKLLGESIFRKFGSDIPVKLNFIDGTEGGSNFTLGIYPGADHLRDYFGTQFQQIENYYIMDVKSKANMYVDIKENISNEYLKNVLSSNKTMEITSLLGNVKLHKHDHMAIPQEVLHSNGHRAMMLHISTAPAIFKASLHEERGTHTSLPASQIETLVDSACAKQNSRYSKNDFEIIEHKGYYEELLAPVENMQIKVSRLWFEEDLKLCSEGVFKVYNLIEGDEITLIDPKGEFEPFIVHFAETFLIPANVSRCIVQCKANAKTGLLQVTANA